MNLRVIFHPDAELELNDGARFYAERRPGLGDAFLDEVRRGCDLLAQTPHIGRIEAGDVRYWPLHRFPYALLYRVLDAGTIRILCVMHQRRRPFYWADRR